MTQDFHFSSEHEKKVYEELFKSATKGEKAFLYKQESAVFFEKSGLPVAILNEILNAVDTENKGYTSQTDFFTALRFIACYQNELPLKNAIDMVQVPLPHFQHISNDINPITEAEREKYIKLFESCNPRDGVIDDQFAMNVFMRSNLPVDKLNQVWSLADTRKSGTLNKTEFIIAMHYISRSMSNKNIILPTSLPSQTYLEATGRFGSSLHRHNTMASPIMRNRKVSNASLISSSLSSPRMSISVSIPLDESERYKNYFEKLDTDKLGYISGEVAAYFFNHSKLPEADLGQIWNLADTKKLGKLDLHDFSVAMHLITRRQNGANMQESYMASELNQIHVQPVITAQTDHIKRAELEQQLEQIKKDVHQQRQLAEEYHMQIKDITANNIQLEKEVHQAKDKLALAKKLSEEAEEILELEQEKRDLLNRNRSITSSSSITPELNTTEPTMPNLIRASSTFSNSTGLMSPPTPATHLSSGKPYPNIKSPQAPLSPVQSKSISKYGFDITAFEIPSKQIEDGISDKDELASLFGAPVLSKPKTTTFDDIFM